MSDQAVPFMPSRLDGSGTAEPFPVFGDFSVSDYRQGMQAVMDLLQHRLEGTTGPFSGILPGELAPLFSRVDLDCPLGNLEQALVEVDDLYLRDAVYFHHPRYLAHLNCPVTLPAVLAEAIQSGVNTAVETWDQSAGATLIEQALVDWTAKRIWLGEEADGVFTTGGTQSNLMAMLLARDHFCQRRWHHCTREQGLPPESSRLRIFASEMSHFSVQKAASLLGLGYQAVVPVQSDRYYRMDPQALEAAILRCKAEGDYPLAVVATAGTTDFGSIDPLPATSALCRAHDIWFHVDAAYGCGLLNSRRHRHCLDGIEQADSVTVDYHKSFFQPVSCSALLVRNRHHLSCVTWHADYLNPFCARQEGPPNLVDKSLQTTRRFDALKLWLTLRTVGADALGEAFDTVIQRARQAYLLLLSEPDIQVIHQPQLSTLVFRYQPAGVDDQTLNRINPAIRSDIMRSGKAMIAGTRVHDRQYLKFTLLNPQTGLADIRAIVELIKQYGGQQLVASQAYASQHAEPEVICE